MKTVVLSERLWGPAALLEKLDVLGLLFRRESARIGIDGYSAPRLTAMFYSREDVLRSPVAILRRMRTLPECYATTLNDSRRNRNFTFRVCNLV